MSFFKNLGKIRFNSLLSQSVSINQYVSPSMILTRNLMKTHRGALKRWRKTANGFKRGIAGRKHGNIGWSHRSLKNLTGRTPAHETQTKRLKRLMPYK
ncbi:hypothetical protein RNJ44_04389 [Nakaseomyces bracarensis]|uniref:50S ribosomal protein L35 n=1 Tax=Nakaseomyces bracarensis TaxID=273131 RepID=A0ABR4NUW2_9SACH